MSVSLINGHIDPDISPEERLAIFNDELENLVDSFYDGCYLRQSKDDVMLEDAIQELIDQYRDIITVSSIETDTCFESCEYDCGVISIALVNKVTGLEHYLLRWESM